MKKGRIIIITGSPGTGKSTISSILAKESNMSKSVNMQTDDFYHSIKHIQSIKTECKSALSRDYDCEH